MTHKSGTWTFVQLFALFAVSLGNIIGCHVKPTTRNGPASCVGERVAVKVHNGSSQAVDVYMHLGQDRNGKILGTAPVGGAEFRLPPNEKGTSMRFEARRSDGTTVTPTFGNRAEFNRITYDVVCQE